MTMRFLTLTQIRQTCGIQQDQINDTDLQAIGEQAEYDTERELGASFTPVTEIALLEADGTNRLVNLKNPLLKVRALKIDLTSVTPSTLRIDKQGGTVWLTSTSEMTYFKSRTTERNLARIKYDHGYFEADTVQTTTSAASVAGDSITLAVVSSTGIAANDYIEITGMDSMVETAKVTSVGGATSITVDNLTQTHESGSLITRQRTPKTAYRLMGINAGLKAIASLGAKNIEQVQSYGLGEESVNNVDVLNAITATAKALQEEKNNLLLSFRIRPAMA